MFKESCIIIVIIVLIIAGNFFIQNYLKNSSDELVIILEEMYDKITKLEIEGDILSDSKEINNIANNLEEKWKDIAEKWTLIVLHSELDVMDLAFSNVKTAIENNNFNDAYLKIKELDFLLSHISERDAFKIKNIF